MKPQIPMWQPVKQALVLAAITGATFLPTLSSKFVYDARMQIATGDFIHDPWNWLPVLSGRVLAMDVLDFNRPAQLASLMLDASLWGRDPFGFHLTSVLLHVLNMLLLWGVMRALPAATAALPEPRAVAMDLVHFLAALAFAVHPVVTEAVCEPTFREDLLVAACTLGALLLAMHHDPAAARGERRRALACAGLCLLAVASKETGVATPAVLATYWWMFRRGDPRPFWTLAVGGGLLAAATFIAARFLLQPETSTIFESRPEYPGGSLQAALALEPRILALYAQLVVCPVNQCADYGAYSVRHLPLPVALAILAGLVAAAWRGIRGDRRIGLAVALIVLPLLPVSNLVPIYRAAADRYLYLPLAGAALWLGWFLDGAWLAARPRLREALGVGMVAMLIALGLACVERQAVWADPLSLWEDTARKNPAAYTPALGLGEALRDLGRLPESERALRDAIRISGGQRGDPWAMLALVLDAQGRGAEARAAVDKALEVQPNLADPAARVRALAMERAVAEDWTRLLENARAR